MSANVGDALIGAVAALWLLHLIVALVAGGPLGPTFAAFLGFAGWFLARMEIRHMRGNA